MQITTPASAGFEQRGIVLGPARGPVAAALAEHRARRAPVPPPLRRARWLLRAKRIAALRARGECQVVHLTDIRLAPFGRWLRARLGVPVSVDIAPSDLLPDDRDDALFDAVDALDAAFAFGAAGEAALRARARRVPITTLPLVALDPGGPSARIMRRLERTLARVPDDQPLVALPWTPDATAWRRVALDLAPLFGVDVEWLVFGVPDARRRTELRSIIGGRSTVSIHTAPLDDQLLAHVARFADAFVVPWPVGPSAPEADALTRIALAATGTPVVASDAATVLTHERNAFLVRDGDGHGFRSTLERLLTLPARQRHYVGAEFAAHVQRRYDRGAAAEVYEERLASLTGAVRIPQELRLAS